MRDTTGTVVDNLYFPSTWLNTPLTITKAVLGALGGREQMMSMEQLLNDSVDPYAFIKEAYYQRKEFQIYDGNPPKKPKKTKLIWMNTCLNQQRIRIQRAKASPLAFLLNNDSLQHCTGLL